MKVFYSSDYVAAAKSFDTTRKSGVTTPAALSCLQHYWDEKGVGLDIETRYVPQEL